MLGAAVGCKSQVDSSTPAEWNDTPLLTAAHDQAYDPWIVRLVAHGSYATDAGELTELTMEHVLATQRAQLQELSAYAARLGRPLATLPQPSSSSVLSISAQIHRLNEELEPPRKAWINQINGALRSYYIKHLLKTLPASTQLELAKDVELMTRRQGLATLLNGAAYIQECANQGVPVFDQIQISREAPDFDGPPGQRPAPGQWVKWGSFGGFPPFPYQTFASNTQWPAHLWSREFDGPNPGLCLALPRWDGLLIRQLGVVCLGYNTDKVCYWDADDIPDGVAVGIESFRGGEDLYDNGGSNTNPGGVCSDCHAGFNPFVVHPDLPPFQRLIAANVQLNSSRWHDPIVHPSWPQNPGPLSGIPSTQVGQSDCATCHSLDAKQAFPRPSAELIGYCTIVEYSYTGKSRLAGGLPRQTMKTMPRSVPGDVLYKDSFERLLDFCEAMPNEGQVVTGQPPDDVGVLSPPIVIGPVYQCARTVAVLGARMNAQVTLRVNGVPVQTTTMEDPDGVGFWLPGGLQVGDEIEAYQSFAGAQSGLSNKVVVRLVTDDYPDGLPAPELRPSQTHECARRVAIDHLGGAQLKVYVNGQLEHKTWGQAWGRSISELFTQPLALGDAVTVTQHMCDESSQPSVPLTARAQPTALRTPHLSPSSVYVGQRFFSKVQGIHEGAKLEISEQSAGLLRTIPSWPLTDFTYKSIVVDLGHALQAGEQLRFQQQVCPNGPKSAMSSVAEPLPCEQVPAPRIEPPRAGDRTIRLKQAIPGAVIRVWSNSQEEIADGSGDVIALTRPLEPGESLHVTQQLGSCQNDTSLLIVVP